ncbi:hypothetical protein [Mesorhizobium sp. CN2-181]|uniref:hypothetical protein n=1 Tax=Mesorhizobium yinganensis TaxID=3157707 RepID=UPI0032B7339A
MTDGRTMVRRNRTIPSAFSIDRDFPHQVALLSDLCVDRNFRLLYDFCEALGVPWHTRHVTAIWPNGKHEKHRLHCFAEEASAAAFNMRFGGILFDPKQDRQRGVSQGPWLRNEPWQRVVRSGPLLVPLALVDAEGPHSRLP